MKKHRAKSPHRLLLIFSLVHLNGFVLGEEAILLRKDHSDPSSWLWLTTIEFGPWSGWFQNGNTGSYTVCNPWNDTKSWLVSEYIDLQGANEIQLSLKFTSRQCLSSLHHCKQKFDVLAYQTDDPQQGGITKNQTNSGNFVFVGEVEASKQWRPPDDTPPINEAGLTIATESKGIYIAFQDTGACIALTSLTISSKYCPSVVNHGVIFNKTSAPSLNQQSITVSGTCSRRASSSPSNSKLDLLCLSSGQWEKNDRVTCLCSAGYELHGDACNKCTAGYYKAAAGNGKCSPCPDNSAPSPNQDSCLCKKGFYRAPQDDLNGRCSAPPSEPRDIKVTVITETVAMVKWSPPVFFGGRSDVTYDLKCGACSSVGDCLNSCSPAQFWPSMVDVDTPQVVISRLNSLLLYNISVISKNGVSLQAGAGSLRASVKTFTFLHLPPSSPTTFMISTTPTSNTTGGYSVHITQKVPNTQSTASSNLASAIGISVTVTFVVCFLLAVVVIALLMKCWKRKHLTNDHNLSTSNLSSQTQLTDFSRSETSLAPSRSVTPTTDLSNDDISPVGGMVGEKVYKSGTPSINLEHVEEKPTPASLNSNDILPLTGKKYLPAINWTPPRSISPILPPRKASNYATNYQEFTNSSSDSPRSGRLDFPKTQHSPSRNSWFPAEEVQYNV